MMLPLRRKSYALIASSFLASIVLSKSDTTPIAPPFELKTLDGNVVRLSELRGKVVLLDFWATWCTPCLKSAPAIKDLQDRYVRNGLVVLGVSLDEDMAKLDAFVARRPPGFVIVTPSADFNQAYGRVLKLKNNLIVAPDKLINANLPSWILIDRKGHLYSIHKSSTEEPQLLREAARLSSEHG
jgi:thiol-disulfide isomerase/thioredoxin